MLGCLDQTNPARWLGHRPVVIVSQLRTLQPVTEAFQIGEPEQVADLDRQPLRKIAERLNRRHLPGRGRPGGLHPLRLVQPFRHRQLAGILPPSALKSPVLKEKLNDLALPRARSSDKRAQERPARGRNQRPGFPTVRASRVEIASTLGSPITKAATKARNRTWRDIASNRRTALQRVSPCMSNRAQGALELKRRNVSSSRSPGVTPERLNRARKLDLTRLGALRRPVHGTSHSPGPGSAGAAARTREPLSPALGVGATNTRCQLLGHVIQIQVDIFSALADRPPGMPFSTNPKEDG